MTPCLSKRRTNDGLRDAFAKFGEVVHVRVVKDCASGWSKRLVSYDIVLLKNGMATALQDEFKEYLGTFM
ncbi:Nucleotide-binding, alpha-beta plait [Artemisia annua]|uniref:Nucleotide-binding, alpha-beta plait n=1 Tax=Artemisia annua TaxID=35608 RepID=A0A2U1LY90_ARTAN|nr:Nucleotide-binding, alpha-beta plait [Artemisia annua]